MSVHILGDYKQAAMYCSTTGWAFGPVFNDSEDGMHDADERIHSFLRWLKNKDPRTFTDAELEKKYSTWLAQEDAQWESERLAKELENEKEYD